MTDTNKTLARIFLETADLLAQRQANPHRIRAYKRAAQTLASLPEDIAAIAGRGELQALPGIGRDLSGKIQEYLETGRIQSHEDLKTPLPSEVETWTTLPGLSESLVRHLYFRLGMRTLDDLETLVRSHLLRTLPGHEVPEDRLLDAIQARRQASPTS